MPDYSSRQAARKLGLSDSGLSKYIRTGKIPTPKSVQAGGNTVYLWTEEDIEQARKLLPKIANGRKTRHQKQSAKPKTKSKKKSKPRSRSAD